MHTITSGLGMMAGKETPGSVFHGHANTCHFHNRGMERDHQRGAISAFTVLVGCDPKAYCRQSWSPGWMRRASATEASPTILSPTVCARLFMSPTWFISEQPASPRFPSRQPSALGPTSYSPLYISAAHQSAPHQTHATPVHEDLQISRKGYTD